MPVVLGGKKEKFSQLDEISGRQAVTELTPRTDAVLGAFGRDALQGPATFDQARDVARIERERQTDIQQGFFGEILTDTASFLQLDNTRQGQEITREQFKEMNMPPGIEFREGITDVEAGILRDRAIGEIRRQTLMGQATTTQNIAGFATGIGASLFEPLNIAANASTFGLSVAGKAGLSAFRNLDRVTETVRRAERIEERAGRLPPGKLKRFQLNMASLKKNRKNLVTSGALSSPPLARQKIFRAGSEGLAATAPIALAGVDNSSVFPVESYDADDAMIELFASGLLSAGFQGLGSAISKVHARKAEESQDRIVEKIKAEKMYRGESPIAEAFEESREANTAHPFSSLRQDQIDNPEIVESDGEFIARRTDEEGLAVGIVGRGGTPEDARQDFRLKHERATRRDLGLSDAFDDNYVTTVKEKDAIERSINDPQSNLERFLARLSEEGGDEPRMREVLQERDRVVRNFREEQQNLQAEQKNRQSRDQLKQQIDSLEGKRRNVRGQINKLKRERLSEFDELNTRLTRLYEQRADAQKRIARAFEEGEDISRIDAEIKNIEGRIDGAKREFKQQENEKAPDIEALDQLEVRHAQLQEEAEELRIRRNNIKVRKSKQFNNLQKRVEEAPERIAQLERTARQISPDESARALRRADQENQRLQQERNRLEQEQLRMQRDAARSDMEAEIQQQMRRDFDHDDPRAAGALSTEDVAQNASEAPEGTPDFAKESQAAERQLEQEIESNQNTDGDKSDLRSIQEEIQARRSISEMLDEWRKCRGQ